MSLLFLFKGSAAAAVTWAARNGVAIASISHLNGIAKASVSAVNGITTPAASTYLSDTFTDTNGTALSSHTMDIGGGWTVQNGTWQVQSNRAKLTTTTANGVSTAESSHADCVITADLVVPNAAGYLLGVAFRYSDTSNFWFAGVERDASGTPYVCIFDRTSGTNNLRASVDATGATNTTVGITVTLSGTSITATLSTSESCNYTSSVRQTLTKHGVYGYAAGGYDAGSVDNFAVNP